MKIISNKNKQDKVLAAFHNMLKMEESRQHGIPLFKNDIWSCVPLNTSFRNPNKIIFQLIKTILSHYSSSDYYIIPIDNKLSAIKTIIFKASQFSEQKSYSYKKETDCGYIYINVADNCDSVFEILNEMDCFSFACYLAIDKSEKWCIVEIEYSPFLYLFHKNDISLEQIIELNYKTILISEIDFENTMKQYNTVEEKYVILNSFKIKFA